jgi:hypothetical protein
VNSRRWRVQRQKKCRNWACGFLLFLVCVSVAYLLFLSFTALSNKDLQKKIENLEDQLTRVYLVRCCWLTPPP